MNRLPKAILLAILMITFAPLLRAQQDSSSAKTYEEYEQQDQEEAATSPDTGEAAPEIYTTTAEEQTDGYAPLFVKPDPVPQRRDRKVSATQWEQMARDADFQYEDPVAPKPVKEKSGPSFWEKFFFSLFDFLATTAGKVIIIIIVALIVIFLVVRAFQLNGNIFFSRRDKKITTEEQDESSDYYQPDNWETAIQQAAAAGNYRLAVRHSYRYLIHLLQETEKISFQAAKTNYQYAYELSGTSLHQPFMQLTRNYEYAWYGGFDIARERFEAYYEQVKGIQKELY